MGLWHDIRSFDRLRSALDVRRAIDVRREAAVTPFAAAVTPFAAIAEQPVSTGVAASYEHTSHTSPSPLEGELVSTIRMVAAHSCAWCVSTPVGVLHMDKDGVAR